MQFIELTKPNIIDNILLNRKEKEKMIVYPNEYFKSAYEITYEYLKKHDIQALILDVDNTLIDYNKNLSTEIINWVNELKQNNIQMFILSNSNKEEKVKTVAECLGLEYLFFGMKPLKKGFKKAKKRLNIDSARIAVVGDQIFTDVIGANRMKMYSILVDPIAEKDIFITLLKRPIENHIKKKYLKTKEEK